MVSHKKATPGLSPSLQPSTPEPVKPKAASLETSMPVSGSTASPVEDSAVDLGIGTVRAASTVKMKFRDIRYKSPDFSVRAEQPRELFLEVRADLNLDKEGAAFLSEKTGHKVVGFQASEVAFLPNDIEETDSKGREVLALEVGGFKGVLLPDEDISSPRENDNVGTMVCFHKRGNYGDEGHGYDFRDYNGWEEMEKAVLKDHPGAVILPVYMYDHSSITLRTTPFNDQWDSGRLGLIYAERKTILKEFGGKDAKRVTPEMKAEAERCLSGEVEEYSKYVNGEGHGYRVTDPDGNEVDSCWGYLGYSYAKETLEDVLLEAANEAARKDKPEKVAP